jgi:hypothetical protein
MFIAIDAKADLIGQRKGKMTPAQHAQLNSWCLASKTGILDCLGKCEADSSSKSFTITNGIAKVRLKSGFIVICGRLVECEAGTTVDVNTNTYPTGKIALRYNLGANGEEEFKVVVTSGNLTQDDLNENSKTGVYEFELYSFTSTSTTLTLLDRDLPYVPDIGGKLLQFEKSLTDEGKPLGGYNTRKGTIEERLTKLGFKQGYIHVISSTGISIAKNTLTRQGNYVIGNFSFAVQTRDGNASGYIEEYLYPKEDITIQSFGGSFFTPSGTATIEIYKDGKVKIKWAGISTNIGTFVVNFSNFGYEATPL